MAPAGLRECPNKGKPGCLGVIEIGSCCFQCKFCRGNKPCSLILPCQACDARISRNAAEVMKGKANADSQAVSSDSSGNTPLRKRTRSKGSKSIMSNADNSGKVKKSVSYACTTKSEKSVNDSPAVSSISSSSSSTSSPSPAAGGLTSGSTETETEEEDEEDGPRSINYDTTPSSEQDVVPNSPSLSEGSPENVDEPDEVLNPISDEFVFSSPDSEEMIPQGPPKPILKRSKPIAMGAWLNYSDGSVEQISVEQYKRYKRVVLGLDSEDSLPEFLSDPQDAPAGGNGGPGPANVSDGSLRGPFRNPVPAPEGIFPLNPSNPRADPVGQQPVPSTSRGTGYEPPYVNPSTGARSRLTGHGSGSALRIQDEEENATNNEDNVFVAGEGGYSEEEEDEEEEEMEEDGREDEEGDSEFSRIDYRGVVDGIRKYCNLQPQTQEPRRNNKIGYERVRRPEPRPRSSLILPWSDSVRDRLNSASRAVTRGQLNSARGARLFRPVNPGLMRFYRIEGDRAAPAELSETLAEYLNDELDNLNRIATAFNPNETRDMSTMIANATAALSWTDLSLQAMGSMPMSGSQEDAERLDHHLVALSRAVGFVLDNLVAMWGNWELKRRDSLLAKVRETESKANRRSLRNEPLFQPLLFRDEHIRELQERLVSRMRDNLILSTARNPAQKRPFQSEQSSQPSKRGRFQPSRRARGGFQAGLSSNRGRGGHTNQGDQQSRDPSQERSNESNNNRRGRGRGKGRGPNHKKKSRGRQ